MWSLVAVAWVQGRAQYPMDYLWRTGDGVGASQFGARVLYHHHWHPLRHATFQAGIVGAAPLWEHRPIINRADMSVCLYVERYPLGQAQGQPLR